MKRSLWSQRIPNPWRLEDICTEWVDRVIKEFDTLAKKPAKPPKKPGKGKPC